MVLEEMREDVDWIHGVQNRVWYKHGNELRVS
jgi:hypothetical protein